MSTEDFANAAKSFNRLTRRFWFQWRCYQDFLNLQLTPGRKFTLRVVSSTKMQRSGETHPTECSICYEVFRDPRRLPCGHTFCTQCLRQLFVDHREFCCPLCRAHFPVPAEGALGFPRDVQIVDELANRVMNDVGSNEDEISIDEVQRFNRGVQLVPELVNRRLYHVGLGERGLLNDHAQGLPRHVPNEQALPRHVPNEQGLPRHVPTVNAMADERLVPNRNSSRGNYYIAFLVLVIAFLIYRSLKSSYDMDKERATWASEKRNCELSEQRLHKQLIEFMDDAEKAQKAEEACLSEKEGCTLSEQRLTRQVQELIAKEKRDSLLLERMKNYIDKTQYTKEPVLSKTFQLQPAESRAAMALTFIDGGLLVANSENGNLKLRDAYSVTEESDWATIPSATVAGMGLCVKNGNVFVSTWNKQMFRFNRNGQMLGQWAVEASSSGVITVTDDCNVVLAVRDNAKKILTYSTYGELINEIEMKTDIMESRLLKAVKLSSGHFLVSYGEGDDSVHGIDIVDANGQTLKSHGWRKGSGTGQLRDPRDFAVDGYGNVLLADSGNGRIILLDSQLKFQRELVSTMHGLHNPLGILLRECEDQLYIADNNWEPSSRKWTNGRIMVFKIR